jgi:dTMP kinase
MVEPAPERQPAAPEGDDLTIVSLPTFREESREPAAERERLKKRLFGDRGFFSLWIAQFVSALGDWLGFLAITVLAIEVGAGAGGAAVGLVMSARIIPGFFLAPVAGVMIDRWDRKHVMVTCDLIRAAVIASLPFVRNVPGLVLASLVLEVCTLLWSPAKEATVPNVVPADKLTNANSMSLAAAYGTFPIAAVIFAFLATLAKWVGGIDALSFLKTDQEALAFYVDMASFLVSALIISRLTLPDHDRVLRAREKAASSEKRIDWTQTFHELKEGWHFIFVNPVVRSVNVGLATGLIGGGMVVPLGSIFARDVLNAGAAGYGVFITCLGFGVAAGVLALSFGQKFVSKARMFELSLLGGGASLIGAASMSSLGPAGLFTFFLGVCAGGVYVVGFTLLHEHVDDELRGRIFSALYTLVRLCLLIAFAIGPFLAEAADRLSGHYLTDMHLNLVGDRYIFLPGVRITLWFAGAIILVAGLMAMWSLRSGELKRFRVVEGDGGTTEAEEDAARSIGGALADLGIGGVADPGTIGESAKPGDGGTRNTFTDVGDLGALAEGGISSDR